MRARSGEPDLADETRAPSVAPPEVRLMRPSGVMRRPASGTSITFDKTFNFVSWKGPAAHSTLSFRPRRRALERRSSFEEDNTVIVIVKYELLKLSSETRAEMASVRSKN